MVKKLRTHKLLVLERGPYPAIIQDGERDDPNCDGTGFRSDYRGRRPCQYCKNGKWPNMVSVPTQGPPQIVHTSLCNNTGYANDPKLADGWDDVDCPACLQQIWLGKVLERKAVILVVRRCTRPGVHDSHIYPSDAEVVYCKGAE